MTQILIPHGCDDELLPTVVWALVISHRALR